MMKYFYDKVQPEEDMSTKSKDQINKKLNKLRKGINSELVELKKLEPIVPTSPKLLKNDNH